MKALRTKEKYFYCGSCETQRGARLVTVVECAGTSSANIRDYHRSSTHGAPDSFFTEVEDGSVVYSSLNCQICNHPIAAWNPYLDLGTPTVLKQIENFPANGSYVSPLWQCGECESQYWEDEEAEECCL